ncbi:MAG: YfcE family phosphodiesterase, partial [Candidatus Omnitrophica bacterium]|nr:YfcE family phosphodiesterase [Candidatus Omnitrophota bacterium]
MPRILVISDTHSRTGKNIPAVIIKEAQKSSCCLHCGDFTNYAVFEQLSHYTRVYGVCGNMDEQSIGQKLPLKQVLKFDEISLGLIHGRGNPRNLIHYIGEQFKDEFEKIDIFVFGHSHSPLDEEIDGKIYFNPGSCIESVCTPLCSYGILE